MSLLPGFSWVDQDKNTWWDDLAKPTEHCPEREETGK